MSTIFHCTNPTCGKKWNVPDHLLERFTKCKECGSPLVKPSKEGNGAAPSGPPAKGTKALEQLGRFQVRARLGAGAFGTVYRAFDPQLEREIALKVPQAGILDSPKRVERFLREAKAAAQLRHPHIVPVYDAGQDDNQYFIASAFIKGNSLAEEVEEGGLDCRRAAKIVQVLAEALAYAHSLDIVHRDIKPANIMLDEEDQPHVMDFGLAARTDSAEKLTQDGAVLGTPAYMAPEQAAGQKGDAKAASDQYSLGVVLYELLCGKTPFEGPPQIVLYNAIHTPPPLLRKLRKDVPRDLETICLKAMAKDTKDRYPDCQAMADDLRRWLEGEPITARRPGFVERVVRWVKREPKLALSGGFALLGLIAVAVALSIIASNLQAEVNQESAEKDKALKAKKDSDDALAAEKDGHKKSLDDLNQKNLDLAQEKIDGNDLGGALIALEKCPKELRNWEWKYLILRAEGLPVQRVFMAPRKAKEQWRGFPPLGFTADSRSVFANFWSQNTGIVRPMSWDLDTGNAVEGAPVGKAFQGPHAVSGDSKRLAVFESPPPPKGKPLPVPAKITIWEGNRILKSFEVEPVCQALAMNFDGSQLAVATMQQGKAGKADEQNRAQVKIWDTETGKELVPLDAFIAFVDRMTFSPNGKQLALVSGNQRTTYRDVTYAVTKMVDGKEMVETFVKKVAESHVDAGTSVMVFDAAGGKKQQEFKTEGHIQALAFSPDSTRLLIGHEAGMSMWDLETGKEPVVFEGRTGPVSAFAFSADGSRIATGSGFDNCARGTLVRLWDSRTGRLVLILPAPNLDVFNSLAFSSDGLHLAAGSSNSHYVVVWSVRPGLLDYYHDGHGGPVTSVAWSPDGELLTSHADCNQTSRLWRPGELKNLLQVPGLFNGGLGFTKDNGFVFTGSGGCLGGCFGLFGGGGCYGVAPDFRLWSRPATKPATPADKGSRFLAISPDAKFLAVMPLMPDLKGPIPVDKLPQVKILDGPDGKELCTLTGIRDGARVAFSEDSRRLASLTMEPTTAFQDVLKQRTEKGPDGKPTTVTYCEKVPVTVHGNVVRIWDARNGKLLLKVGLADMVALSNDGTRLATCENRPMFAEPIPPKKMPAPPATEVEEVSFNQDGPKPLPPPLPPLMGNPFVPQIKIWDVDSGKLLHTLGAIPMPTKGEKIPQKLGSPAEMLPGVPTRMCFSPDGKTLVAAFPATKQTEARTKTVYETVYKEEGGKKVPIKVAKQIAYEVAVTIPAMVKAWRVLTGKELFSHRGASGVLAFSPDGKKLASAQGMPHATYGGTYAAPPTMPIPEPPKGSPPVMMEDMGFVSAQKPLPKEIQPPGPGPKEDAEPPLPPDIKIWDLGTGKEVFTLRNRGAVTCLAFSHDGKRLASASGNFGPTMEPGMMEANTADFVSTDEHVAFGHRSYGATAKSQAIITVWSMQNGKDTVHIHGHVGPVNCLAFRPDGRALASAGDDGTVKIWKMNQS